jgi:hypothetical protein
MYEFIEKYSVPMIDKDGYKELVIHPPPLNFLTIFVVFGVFKRSCMKSLGDTFSKLVFWFENIPFIFAFLIYEISLVPLVYFKQLTAFVAKSNWKNFIPLTLFWLILGPFVILFLGVIGDLMSFLRVLCDYKLAEEEEKEKAEEEFNKDKVVLYNEIMDVLRAIMHIYKQKENEDRSRRKKLL